MIQRLDELCARWKQLPPPYRLFTGVAAYAALNVLYQLSRMAHVFRSEGVRPSGYVAAAYALVLVYACVWSLGMFRARRSAVVLSNVFVGGVPFVVAYLYYGAASEMVGRISGTTPRMLLWAGVVIVYGLCCWAYCLCSWRAWCQAREQLVIQPS
jgi:hypothetical protein